MDALEDDLVNKFENEKKEKDKQKVQQPSTNEVKEAASNFMIFERHFEDKREGG